MSKLLRASGPADVVRAAASFASEQLGAPVAGWLDTTADTRSSLVAAHGFDADASRLLRRSMRLVRRWSWLSEGERREVRRKFAEIARVPAATAVDSGQALLLLGGTEQPLRRWTRPLKSILADSLGYSQTVTTARRREAQLDMGLAWTAHELRGPLLTARMAMDLAMEGQRPGDNELALAARRQLDSLAGLVDDLLHWSVGARPPRRTRVSLLRLVREAVDEVTTGVVNDRVGVRATDRPLVAGDSDLLRGAVGNLVRNALAYSSEEGAVAVDVYRRNGTAIVSVTDQGPGIPDDERDTIFDPFVRGHAARGTGGGGLGLFIVRRVAEAHGGAVRLDSNTGGTTFHLEIPVAR